MGGDGSRDHVTILAGTGQNVVGLGVFVIASFGMNILIARAFGKGSAALGQITVATQLAFVAGAATRFGMDMAAVRRVAIEVGKAEGGRPRDRSPLPSRSHFSAVSAASRARRVPVGFGPIG